MARVVLITGSNMGDLEANTERAIGMISCRVGTIIALSSRHKSNAWGFEADDFMNQVVIVQTTLSPMELLEQTQQIEREFGRHKGQPEFDDSSKRIYKSRPMDIDILFYDDLVLESGELTIPHPHIAERDFVLTPLKEVEDMLGDKITEAYKKTLYLQI